MRVVVTGGRDYLNARHIEDVLDGLKPDDVFVGDCPTGADSLARNWCRRKGVPVQSFTALWSLHGRAAGPMRNEQMLRAAGPAAIVIAFPGGRGTADCIRKAKGLGMSVYETLPKAQPEKEGKV